MSAMTFASRASRTQAAVGVAIRCGVWPILIFSRLPESGSLVTCNGRRMNCSDDVQNEAQSFGDV